MTEPTLTSSVAKVPALVEQAGDAPAPTCGPAGPRTPAAPTPPTGGISRPGLRLPACSPFRQHRRPWASTWPPRLRTSGLALLLATWWPLRPPIGQPGNRSIPVPLTLAGIKRTHGTNQNGKAPAVIADLRAMISAQPDTLAGLRDRALLLLGFAGALRRSELVGLDVEDLDFTSAGLVVTLRRSKTDQDGGGRRVGVPYGSQLETRPVRTSHRPLYRQERPPARCAPGRQGRRFHRQAGCAGGGPRSDAVRRSLAACRSCDLGRRCRGLGARHLGHDGASAPAGDLGRE